MNSVKCVNCSLVNFSSSEACKRCGEPLGFAGENEFHAQPASFETFSGQSSYQAAPEPYGQAQPSQSYYPGSAINYNRGRKKGVSLTILALICLVGLIGIPWYLKNRGPSELANLSWKEFKPDDGSFSILLPGDPKKESMNMQSPAGNITVTMYGHETAGKTAFAMGVIEFPSTLNMSVDALYAKALQSLANRSQVTVLSQRNITLDGRIGLEAEIKPPPSANLDGDKGVMRLFWVSPRMYMVMVGGPDSTAAATARAKFLESFKILRSR